jgi:hypothetical protein
MGDVRGDSVKALLDVSTGSAYLGLLRALGGEVCIFDFERKRAEDLGTVSSWDAPNKGGRKPSKHPFVRLAHTELSPGAINRGGDRDRPLLDGVSTAFTLGGKGDPNLGDGAGPGARVFDDGEKLGKAVPDGYGDKLEVLNRPTIESPGFALRHAENGWLEIPASKVGDRVLLRMGAEEISVFFLKFAKDGRTLRAMKNIFVPSEGG